MKRETRRTLSLAAKPDSARRLTQHPFDAEFQVPGSNVCDAEMISALPPAASGRKHRIDLPEVASRQGEAVGVSSDGQGGILRR